jgi:hypothetical protein
VWSLARAQADPLSRMDRSYLGDRLALAVATGD